MKTSTKQVNASAFTTPPQMRTNNEHTITQAPCETTCFTDADTVWDSNFPRCLEVISHGPWNYGPRGEFDL